MTNFPLHITFLSDSTEAKLIDQTTAGDKAKTKFGVYEFTEAKVNRGLEFTMSMPQVEWLLDNKMITIK